jgi:Uma2 family endonuclease
MLTLRRKKLRVGLEPDECYYVKTPPPPPIEGEVDLMVHGSPDLAIEVEISKGVIPKMPVYQALKVAEICRYSTSGVTPFLLTSSGEYKASKKSLSFPKLDMVAFSGFVAQALSENEHKAVKALQSWARASSKRDSQ